MGVSTTITREVYKWQAQSATSVSCDVVDRLMRTACRICKHYASDLYYDLTYMSKFVAKLADGTFGQPVFRHVMTFRDGGVDGPQFTRARLLNEEGKDYKAFYIFEARKTRGGDVEQTLARVDRAKMKLYVETRFNEKGEQLPEEA